jgi:hypothetical protein
MIQLIEAPPRSGKSYFAVNYLVKFTEFDAIYNEYVLAENVLVISNIEGLKIKHWNLDEVLKNKTLQEFFSIENFENIMKRTGKNHIILCIDECHDYFPAGMTDKDIYSFFAFHGHLGLDIILMTQGIQSMSRMFNPLLEYIVKVTPRSRAILNNFSYSYTDLKGRFLYSKSLPKKDLVFGAYKSFRKDEQQKPKNAIKHWAIIVIILLVVAGGLFKSALALVNNKAKGPQKPASASSKPATAPPVQTSVAPPACPIQKPLSSVQVGPIWREYTVEAYIRDGGKQYYLIDGNFIDSVRCRNYSSVSKTVEYFSTEKLTARRAISAAQSNSHEGWSAGSPTNAKALAEAYSPLNLTSNDMPLKTSTAGFEMKQFQRMMK